MTSLTNKLLTVLLLMQAAVAAVWGQDVHYYKLTRKVVNNQSSTSVSGGQFITFMADICYESDIKGRPAGHGSLKRNDSYSDATVKTYQGGSYWGSNATFKFNSDKSVLNVVTDGGDIYVYKRQAAPVGVTTCSLIRKKQSSGSSSSGSSGYAGGGYDAGYNSGYSSGYNQGYNAGSSSTPSSAGTQSHSRQWRTKTYEEPCSLCHGMRTCNTCNGKRYYYDFNGRSPCPNCTDGNCTRCQGRGTITKTRQVFE